MTKDDKPVNLFWTGGWDSTFRLLDLLLLKKKAVKPYYLIDSDRLSTGLEIRTMKDIKMIVFEKYPEARELLLPTEFHEINDIKENAEITEQYKILRKSQSLGSQYDWLARFADEHGISNLELSIEKDFGSIYNALNPILIKSYDENDSFHEVKSAIDDSPIYALFKYFRFPTYHLTKLDMKRISIEHDFFDIMELTWFCHYPRRNGVPCGICNPCIQVMKLGLGWRIPFIYRMKYYIRKALHIHMLKSFVRSHRHIYRCAKYIKNALRR